MSTALVTGATAGLGAAFAHRLAADGHDLVLVARSTAALTDQAAELRGRHGIHAEALPADLSTEDGIAAVERRLGDRDRPVDMLVNNAGFGQRASFPHAPLRDELAMLRVHVETTLRLTHTAVPGMVQRGHGAIVNVASIGAFFPRGTYGASKAWAVSFTRALAQDLAGTGIRATVLCPGFVRTEFHTRAAMDVSSVPNLLWLDADKVIDTCLRDLRHGRVISIPGLPYRLIVRLGPLLPRLTGRLASRTGRDQQ